ncbi:MAG: hypothetical protein NVSMB27_42990 [Ktedonobacteraceae bacterium]
MPYSHDPDAMQPSAGVLSPHSAEPSDESLLNALASGAAWAMEPLYNRYSGLLYSLASRIVGEQQVAEEVVQDAFLAVWQHATSYSPQAGPVRGWLLSVLRHRAIDYLRRVHRRSSWKELPWEVAEWEEEATLPDVWEDAWSSEKRAQVREALLQLPSEQRLVIALAYFRGWTHKEIAQRCELPFGTVKARIRLGLFHLKQALEQREIGETAVPSTTNRREAKPRQTVTVVVRKTESICAAGYELCRDGSCRCFGYTEWEPLVEQIEAFEFCGAASCFSARKSRRAHGRTYWYAFRRGGYDRKAYLGKSAELTLPHLEAMATELHKQPC